MGSCRGSVGRADAPNTRGRRQCGNKLLAIFISTVKHVEKTKVFFKKLDESQVKEAGNGPC